MGKLPASRQWKAVVALITGGASAADVAAETAVAAEQSLAAASKSTTLRYAFWLLTQIPLAARSEKFGQALQDLGLIVSDRPNLVEIGAAMMQAIDRTARSSRRSDDICEIASKTATESLVAVAGRTGQSLFGTTYAADEAREILKGLSTPGQFAVLARDFILRLTKSVFSYFLSRALPLHVGMQQRFQTFKDHHLFKVALNLHCLETSLIVERFAQEWFSRTNFEGGITPTKAGGFIHIALGKVRAELQARRGLAHA